MEKKSIKADIQTLSITDDPQCFYEITTEENNPTFEEMIAMQKAFSDMEKDLEAKTLTRVKHKLTQTITLINKEDLSMDDVLANLSEVVRMCD